MKLCKGFRDLLEMCCEAFYYWFFFLPALGVGMLWGAGELILFALCTGGVVCSWCKIPGTQVGAGGDFASEDVLFSFFHFLIFLNFFFYSCLAFALQFSYTVSFTLLVTRALLCFGVAVGEVGCAALAPQTPEQDALAGLHAFGLNLWAFGCWARRSDAPLHCKDVRCTAPSTGGLGAGPGFGRR